MLYYCVWHCDQIHGGKKPNASDKAAVHNANVEGVVLSDADLKWREQRMEELTKGIQKIKDKRETEGRKYKYTLEDWLTVLKAFLVEWPFDVTCVAPNFERDWFAVSC